jgi:pyrroloquinoline quinone (PQQ) biosynthesis protein C
MRNNFLINNESACFVPDETAIKTANCNQGHRCISAGNSDRLTSDANKIANTQKLLDRAIAYAWHTVKSDRRPPKLTPTRWVWRMAGAYHSSCHTSRLMSEAAQRFAASGRMDLAQWAKQKAREEAGHDQLALLDIQSMGYEAEAVVQALVPSAATTVIDYFTQSVQAIDPIGCVGYCYASERLGTFQGEEYIQNIEALLPDGTHATRWLRIHTAVGAEVKHVEETVEIVAAMTPEECIRVARACYETSLLRFTPPKEGYISDEKLENVLKPLKLNTCLRE